MGFSARAICSNLRLSPPSGAATLTAFIAALILAWRSGVRFGPSRREKRAYALGKRALADNSASLIRMAGREHRYGASYAALISRLAARAPPELRAIYMETHWTGFWTVSSPSVAKTTLHLFRTCETLPPKRTTVQVSSTPLGVFSNGNRSSTVNVADIRPLADDLRQEIAKAVIGQDDTIDLMLTALFARGHILFGRASRLCQDIPRTMFCARNQPGFWTYSVHSRSDAR